MSTESKTGGFWPNGAKLAISVSLMFEGGGQPISGSGGPISEPIKDGLPDLPTKRLLRLRALRGHPTRAELSSTSTSIKVSSFMIGKAVENAPELAQEIVRRGHEAAAHGRTWQNSYMLSREEEKRFIADSQETIHRVTGPEADRLERVLAAQLRAHPRERCRSSGSSTPSTSRATTSPSSSRSEARTFVTVPYTFNMNDISSFPFENYNPMAYEQALKR